MAIESISVDVRAGRVLHLLVLDRQDLLDAVDDHAGGLGPGLDDHDLGVLAELREATPSRAARS